MKWISPLIVVMVLSIGCHAPMPRTNFLAPCSPTRVPPPATGAIGANGGRYYQPPSTPVDVSRRDSKPLASSTEPAANVWSQASDAAPVPNSPPTAARVTTVSNTAPVGSGVAQAGFEQPVRATKRRGSSSSSASQLRLNGIHVNDATTVPFLPPSVPSLLPPPMPLDIYSLPPSPPPNTGSYSPIGTTAPPTQFGQSRPVTSSSGSSDAPLPRIYAGRVETLPSGGIPLPQGTGDSTTAANDLGGWEAK